MAAVLLFALTQLGVLALYHFGEADVFWFGALELIWSAVLVIRLIALWVGATYGRGV